METNSLGSCGLEKQDRKPGGPWGAAAADKAERARARAGRGKRRTGSALSCRKRPGLTRGRQGATC